MNKWIVTTLFFGAFLGNLQAQNIVKNGSFESGSISDWKLITSSSSVDVNSFYGTSSGKFALMFGYSDDLGAEIEQEIPTIPGAAYLLELDWKASHAKSQKLDVIVESKGREISRLGITGVGETPFNANSPFRHYKSGFVADGTSVRLRFIDRSNSSFQVNQVIDNITVTEATSTVARQAKDRAREDERRANLEKTREDERQVKSERERNANACNSLYVGKPVSYKLDGCAIYCSRNGVVTGIGRGVAGVKSSDDGVVREKSCSELN